jgi:hypothetical protein
LTDHEFLDWKVQLLESKNLMIRLLNAPIIEEVVSRDVQDHYHADSKVVVCGLCRCAVSPEILKAHLKQRHKENNDDLSKAEAPATVA